jgi:hypothetical protein
MEVGGMTNAEVILRALDSRLTGVVDLTLYGRAALTLGFPNAPADCLFSHDVDAVLRLGQAEELSEQSNFWEAVEAVNRELAERDLYVSHFFTEAQVILRPCWREQRVPIAGDWRQLRLFRLSDADLLLSKLMRDDPLDHADARFICAAAGLARAEVERAIEEARVPDSAEVREDFAKAAHRLLAALGI